jgi:hypothetical protein
MEAEIADGGDLTHFAQAMQNALRGPTPVLVKRIATPPAATNGIAEHTEPDLFDAPTEEVEATDVMPMAPKVKTQRKAAPKPNIIPLDINTEPSLSSLVDPDSNHGRYLAIARWLHDHRNTPVITQDHVWTCYRHLGWPTDILDFAQPLRELKHKQYFTTPERGNYAINQLGLAKAAEAVTD